ncbi:Metallo-hydrolase/oxidoreductase [Xylariaceae sp. FL0016]|nr:Metallo-hydrolase/oxidoreductase [Xylariaceae sp. FL0016]
MSPIQHLRLDASKRKPLLNDQADSDQAPSTVPIKKVQTHPRSSNSDEDASVYFIGTATTIVEWEGIRILTDPNFLHAGDHVLLGPGITAQRRTNPAVDLHALPAIDCILLSHYHEDHFNPLVEKSLNREFDIITTPHAKGCLTSPNLNGKPFQAVHALDVFESMILHIDGGGHPQVGGYGRIPVIKVTGMPGKHVPPGPLAAANDLMQAVPPTNGWLLELGHSFRAPTGGDPETVETGYRIYISGDTLFVDELSEIPRWLYENSGGEARIDLMLAHLGGTTIPGPSMPLLTVTMDAKQGVKLMQLMDPDVTIPIQYDDYDVFMSPLQDFKDSIDEAGLEDQVVYLERGEQYRFKVRGP